MRGRGWISVLLVDGEEPARRRLRTLLEDYPEIRIVGEAGDGDEALVLAETRRPQVIFLDIPMPGLNGLELAARIPPPRPLIVFCTAYDRHAVKAFELNAVDYLLKPVTPDMLARAVRRLRTAVRAELELTADLERAESAQGRLLADSHFRFPGLEAAGWFRPAGWVSGDFYDFAVLDRQVCSLSLGDVSGKGVAAALRMAAVQGFLRVEAIRCRRDLGELASVLNRFCCEIGDDRAFVTLVHAVFDAAERRLAFFNAGHFPPLLVRAGGSEVTELAPTGPVLGLLRSAPFGCDAARLGQGDLLVLYSDGVIDELDEKGREFGRTRLEDFFRRPGLSEQPVHEIRDGFVDEWCRFAGATVAEDDATLLVVKGTHE
jgi:sigma-B regulation protein RsbU (phosphoserine phosphatase)